DQRLLVAQVGERVLLLGVSPAQVTLLEELSPDEAALWTDLPPGGQPPGFREALTAALHHKKNSQ
ncbi:MAG: flagellar biosynthetic protein FliO, partial [Oscillospiraceae bacterium]